MSNTITDWTPYSNICPISGHTGMTGKRTGKNLYDISKSGGSSNTTYTRDGNQFVLTANNATWASAVCATSERIRLHAGITYTVSAYCTVLVRNANYPNPKLSIRDLSNTTIASANFPTADNVEELVSFQYTPSEDVAVYLSSIITGSTAGNASVRVRNPIVEIRSAVTDYEPYIEKDISINWQDTAGTVYGGTRDVISGVLTADRETFSLNGSTAISSISELTNVIRFWAYTDSRFQLPDAEHVTKIMCDRLVRTTYSADTPSYGVADAYPSTLIIKLPIGTCEATVEGIRAYLQSNPLQFVLPLANPVTYQLTPQEVITLLGTNNIWADVGPVNVEYPVDTNLYINKKIQEIVS